MRGAVVSALIADRHEAVAVQLATEGQKQKQKQKRTAELVKPEQEVMLFFLADKNCEGARKLPSRRTVLGTLAWKGAKAQDNFILKNSTVFVHTAAHRTTKLFKQVALFATTALSTGIH